MIRDICGIQPPLVYCLLSLELVFCISLTTDPVRSRQPLSKKQTFDDGISTLGQWSHTTAIAVGAGGMLRPAAGQDSANEVGEAERNKKSSSIVRRVSSVGGQSRHTTAIAAGAGGMLRPPASQDAANEVGEVERNKKSSSIVRRVLSFEGAARKRRAVLNTSREALVSRLKRNEHNNSSTTNGIRVMLRAPGKQLAALATMVNGESGRTFLGFVLVLVTLVSCFLGVSLFVVAQYDAQATGRSLTQSWHTMLCPLLGESRPTLPSPAGARCSRLQTVMLNRTRSEHDSLSSPRRSSFIRRESQSSPTATATGRFSPTTSSSPREHRHHRRGCGDTRSNATPKTEEPTEEPTEKPNAYWQLDGGGTDRGTDGGTDRGTDCASDGDTDGGTDGGAERDTD